MWTKNVGPKMRWEQAPGYCRGLALEGYTGWRLPTLEELSTLAWPDHPEPRQEKCEGEP